MTPQERLDRQVHVFNAGVHSGDFSSYSELFLPDAELKLVGGQEPGQGNYHGRSEIAQACASVFTDDDAMRIVSVISAKPESATVDYAWDTRPKDVAGQMIVKWTDELIRCLTLTL